MKATAEELLAGANQSAKVAIIRLLADLQPFRRDGECPVCKERESEAPNVEAKLLALLARNDSEREAKVRAIVRQELAVVAEHVDVSTLSMRGSLSEDSHICS